MLCQKRYAALALSLLLLTGCNPQFVTVTVTAPPETVVVTATPSPTSPTPSPEPQAFNVCLVGEPDTLYLYGGSNLPATRHVMEALYDGPIDHLDYTYRPVILQKMPSLADGDVFTRSVRVRAGDRVVDADGAVVDLVEGVRIRPRGCYGEECVVEFGEEPLWMERMYVTFALREDVTWADGEPIRADDSLFAFRIASDPATPGRRDLVERTARYRMLDEYRVEWSGLPGFLPSTYFLNFFAPLPRHQLEGRDPGELPWAEETRRHPLGWGPFVVDEWVTGEYISLSRNPHYFRASEGLPHLRRLVFRFTSGAPDLVTHLLSGECDIGVGADYADFEPLMPMLVQAEQEGLLNLFATTSDTWEQIDFGIDPVPGYRRADLFGDVRVRQAVALCIDRQAIVDEVTYGYSVVPDSYLPPGHPLSGDYLVHWDYDPATGQALLEEVGWLDEDGDGVREARYIPGVRTGTRFEITLLVPSMGDGARHKVGRVIETNLKDCGIQVTLEALPSWEFFANGPEGRFFGRQFDLAETTRQFDDVSACEHYTSAEIPDRGRWHGDNASGYSNPDYDTACQAALQALPGAPEYEEYNKQALAIFSEELPAVPLFMWLRVALARPGVLNFAPDSTAPSELWNIETIDVE